MADRQTNEKGTTMIDKNDDWGIIERAYEVLQDLTNCATEEEPVDPNNASDYDLDQANEETAYEITGTNYPEVAMLGAFARQGYLDNDPIWYQIGEAIRRGLEAYADEIWHEHQENAGQYDEDEDE